jgi:ADP-ribosylglycohydrolase
MALGDALGLPREGLSPKRQKLLFPDPEKHAFFLERGMISDDTDHACMVAQALLASGGDSEKFERALAWRLRFWLLNLPAGVGFATGRAILKLWLGFRRSGVWSAGNGPAMRAPLLGVLYQDNPAHAVALLKISTRMTHTDFKALLGAISIAALTARPELEEVERWISLLDPVEQTGWPELREFLKQARISASLGHSTVEFAKSIGLGESGVTGYMYHTVPVVAHAYFRYPTQYRTALLDIISCGGDSDSTAAILGGMIGAHIGPEALPEDWKSGIWEWPRSLKWMDKLAWYLSLWKEGKQPGTLPVAWWGFLPRNLFQLGIVLGHGFRRLLPPY